MPTKNKPKPAPRPNRSRPSITVTLSPESMAAVERRLVEYDGLYRNRSHVIDRLIRAGDAALDAGTGPA